MIHPHVTLRFINDVVGFGVVATERLPAGTITWCLDPLDIRLSAEDARRLGGLFDATLDRYTWTDRDGERVLCWDIGRYMNHSCRPNSMSPGLAFEVALRDIEPGEELVCDYGTLNLDGPFECACGEPGCRGTILPEDFETFADAWDAQLQPAFAKVLDVPQPLLPLVPPEERALFESIVAGKRKLPSVRTHRRANGIAPYHMSLTEGGRDLPESSRPEL